MDLITLILFALLLITVFLLVRPNPIDSPPVVSLGLVLKNGSHAIHGRFQEVLAGYQEIQKRYGSIVAYPLSGGFISTCVFISDYRRVKEAFKSSGCFGRPNHGFTFMYFNEQPRGLGLQDDESKWREIRNFTFQKLKEHGVSKHALDVISSDEASILIGQISQSCNINKPILTDDLICVSMMNVLWRVIAGKRFNFDNSQALRVYNIISGFFTAADFKTMLLYLAIGILGNISTKLVLWVRFLEPLQVVREFLLNHTKSSKDSFKAREVNTFTDAFLQKIHETTNPDSMFFGRVGEENLAATIGEILGVGAKSSSVTLQWIFLFLAAHPDKQALLQEEIDRVLGGRIPTFDDKKLMPYTMAVIQEVSRIIPLFPVGVPHKALEDTYIGGYKIRKGSLVISNTAAIHSDPEIWGWGNGHVQG
ncbi:unnamed protein product, partial [Allacma fusca]